MIKKPRLNLVNRGGGIRSNKPVAAVTRRPDPPPPPPPAPFLPPEIPPAPVAPIKVTTESTPPPPKSTAEKVGGLLAEARKAQGRTIAELAEATHIRDIHLQALEAGAIERLPGITFVAGFMRLYARHLNIADTDPIESFLETLDQKRQGLQMERFPAPTKANHRPGLGLIILGIGALVGCFMAYDRYYAPTRNIPAIPSAPPLRV
ncbi:MAG TPA: helix-turn-helix domain-containing protein, partial [Magnetococcales bacterium]|nr:helix-turn-helix domain-containing protein [Magnetococcales bacterium]